ncbi:DUF2809 domain-containing protein [Zhouia sp. PK063]|uniref:DUF2809 domain-containing protein n=1 Tax=Zhouia sp. PK063 TaxID=3373602 RepID=UPI0037B01B3F
MLSKFQYGLLALLFFLIEVCIALFFHDRFVRPVLGDYLVIFLIYCILKSIINLKPNLATIAVLLFAYAIEFSQYIHITKLLHIKENTFTRMVLGSSFSWEDMMAYTLAAITIMVLENKLLKKSSKHAKN